MYFFDALLDFISYNFYEDFASLFLRDIALQFSIFVISLIVLLYPNTGLIEWVALPLLLFSGRDFGEFVSLIL